MKFAKLLRSESALLVSYLSLLVGAVKSARKGDGLASLADASQAVRDGQRVLVSLVARSAKASKIEGRTVPSLTFDALLSGIIARTFDSGEVPTLKTCRIAIVGNKATNVHAMIIALQTGVNREWKRINATDGDEPATVAETKASKVSDLRLTQADLATLQRDGSLTVQLSKRQSIRIIRA